MLKKKTEKSEDEERLVKVKPSANILEPGTEPIALPPVDYDDF